jgi:predicted DCC family thiol-disulfide oxidoreductase YuxK
MQETEDRPIVFFDGVCGLCNSVVDILLRIDTKQLLYFSPLQGETAKSTLDQERLNQLDTIFYKEGNEVFEKSTAVLRILMKIGGIYSVASLFLIIPKSFRDWIYCWVARNRYRFFGKKDTCRLPTAEERARFID